ncbi:unnamed protein product [Sphenostylis stenocarpa]|uniref:Uncharacterized protein n=1 Tax=Sphenostylis stenocarpa TaxID=92480 RepID=A0AA86ST69_9FABA|nr:unnamed protein product [Sphenostylis stenocarpa]
MDEQGGEDEFRRCSRSASGGWRCKERAMGGRRYCERHCLYSRQRNEIKKKKVASGCIGVPQKRTKQRKKPEGDLENGVVVGGVVGNGAKGLFGDHDGGTHAVEEFAGLYGEGNDGGLHVALGCESFRLWGEEEGQHVHVHGFGGGFGTLGQVEGRVQCQPWRNGNAGGVFDDVQGGHASRAGVHVCENDFLELTSEGVEGLMVEADFDSLYDQGCEEDVIFVGSDIAMPDSAAPGAPGGTGIHGLGSENAYEFKGEEVVEYVGNPDGYCKVKGETFDGIDVPGSKDKHVHTNCKGQTVTGNNKAGKNGMNSVTVLGSVFKIIDEGEVLDEIVRPMKSDRPKDSTGKCSVANLESVSKVGEESAGLIDIRGTNKCGRRKSSKKVSSAIVLESERSVFSVEEEKAGDEVAGLGEMLRRPKKRGRQKGLNRMSNVTVLEEGEADDEEACLGEIVRPKKLGRPKGSTNRMSMMTVLESERPLLSVEEGKAGVEDAGLGEIVRPKKRGRPKGSRNEKFVLHVSDNVVVKFAGTRTLGRPIGSRGRPKGSRGRNKSVVLVGNQVVGEIAGPRKRGRPKGSKNKMNNIVEIDNKVEVENEVAGSGEIAGRKKHGRPKGSTKIKKNALEVNNEFAGDGEVRGLKKYGQPEGSKKWCTGVCTSSNEVAVEIARQDVENKMSSNLCQNVLDELASLNNKYGPSMSTRSDKKSFVFQGQMYPEMSSYNHVKGDDGSTSGLEKEKGTPREPVKEIENNKITWSIVKRGRPKGSRNKVKLAGQDMASEVVLADIVLCPADLGTVATCAIGEENIGSFPKISGSAKCVDGDDKYCVKPKHGRPKGSKNMVREAGNNFDKGQKTHSMPKNSNRKEKESAYQFDSLIESHGPVVDKEGKISAESASRSDISQQKKNYSQQKSFRSTRQTIKQSQSWGLKEQTPAGVNIVDENESDGVTQRSTIYVTKQPLQNQNITRFSKVLSRIKPQKQVLEECVSMLEDQVKEVKKSDFLLEFSEDPGNENAKRTGLTGRTNYDQKRRSERLKALLIDGKNFQGVGGEEAIYHGLESKVLLSDTEARTLRCHQCWRKSKSGVVICIQCKRKRYCYECIGKWYPDKTREEIETACPFCLGNCNCRLCLKEDISVVAGTGEADTDVKLQKLFYLLDKILPLLHSIQREQISELEIESNMLGSHLLEEEVVQSLIDDDERVYCDNCNTSIANFHRSCPNPNCQYDLCLTCCMELRNEFYCEEIPANGNEGTDDTPPVTFWRAEINGGIPCPPKARGGCGSTILSLRRLFKANWVDKLIKNAEELTFKYKPPNIDLSLGCPICHRFEEEAGQNSVRKAASRDINHGNFLYCPDAVNMGDTEFQHFQRHWMRGEPVIVRNLSQKGSGLSWHPMVMWRAFMGAKKILKDEATTFKAIDCLDWCEVHA